MSNVPAFALQLFDPRGRCNRKGLLIVAGLLLGVELIAGLALWATEARLDGTAALALKLIFCWLALAAGSKRLHDMNLSAWWMLAAVGATIVWTMLLSLALALAIGVEVLQPTSSWYWGMLAGTTLPVFCATLWLHFARGAGGANRFGPEPAGLGFSGPHVRSVGDVAQAAAA
jgi:uncharacterized membrane protein YhaH (DUF805 family)